jgi:hypothetical protein
MSKFSRQIRSKSGVYAIIGILAALVLLIFVGDLVGWWDLIPGVGTAVTEVFTPPTYNPPVDGYTCLPTCDEADTRFLSMPGEDMASFGGASIVAWVSVPANYSTFTLEFFDGDSGKAADGTPGQWWLGHWDNTSTETTYRLYADPLKDGPPVDSNGNVLPDTPLWTASSNDMPDNAWSQAYTFNNTPQAMGPLGHYYYRLEITRPAAGHGINALKVRSNAYLSVGQANYAGANFAIVSTRVGMDDLRVHYPQFVDWSNPGTPAYNGEWNFYIYVPTSTLTLEFWDGDFDRGTTNIASAFDTDDPNTPPTLESWMRTSGCAADPRQCPRPEGAQGIGLPPDDVGFWLSERTPPVYYEIRDPNGNLIFTNEEPSGTSEWEHFVLSADPNRASEPDYHSTTPFQPGYYNLRIIGLDVWNTVWLRFQYEIVDEPFDECDATCPRTIGYWKNNVKKIFIQGRTTGVQESRESIEAALRAVAQMSPIYRSGLIQRLSSPGFDFNNPNLSNINPNPVPLTGEEANILLQRDKNNYPQGRTGANSMLARALQQNLAAWLNLGSGKICKHTNVNLQRNGTQIFSGTMWDALQAAQQEMLTNGNLERAKDIADIINNGQLGEDADYVPCDPNSPPPQIPPEQPPTPAPPPPPQPTIPPEEPDTTCDNLRVNTYGVEITNNPFPGIKFEYRSGTEVKNGAYDEFRVTLSAAQAASADLTAIQVEVKAATLQEIATIGTGEPTHAESGNYAFQLTQVIENDDGSVTLVFWVYNYTNHGISHVTIGLTPDAPPNQYQSQVCP